MLGTFGAGGKEVQKLVGENGNALSKENGNHAESQKSDEDLYGEDGSTLLPNSENNDSIASEKYSDSPIEIESGAKKTKGWQDRHADRYYEEVRNRAAYSDAQRIVSHISGFTIEEIEDIRQHLFIREHHRDGRVARFDSDYQQAQAWQRLAEGKNIRPSDIIMLRHEQMELRIMRETECTYEEAHEQANKVYNWAKEIAKER